MIIVGIVGTLDLFQGEDKVWRRLHEAFIAEFPDATFVVEHKTYVPWQNKRINSFAKDILVKYDTGEDLLLVGFSLGGVIACDIAQRFNRSRIRAIVTIGAPHRMKIFHHQSITKEIQSDIPVYTFGGIFDPIVPWFTTRYPGSIHTNLFSDHLISFLWSKKSAVLIAQKTKIYQSELN